MCGRSETLAAGISDEEHHHLSDETLVLHDDGIAMSGAGMERAGNEQYQPQVSELSRRSQRPEKLSKRSLELFNLHS